MKKTFQVGDQVRITRRANDRELSKIGNSWPSKMDKTIDLIGTIQAVLSNGNRGYMVKIPTAKTERMKWVYPEEVLELITKDRVALLEASIKHWEKIYQGVEYPTRHNCPLCSAYMNVSPTRSCDGCPIFEETKKSNCESTPYTEYTIALSASRPRIALEELCFLMDLKKKAEEGEKKKKSPEEVGIRITNLDTHEVEYKVDPILNPQYYYGILTQGWFNYHVIPVDGKNYSFQRLSPSGWTRKNSMLSQQPFPPDTEEIAFSTDFNKLNEWLQGE